MTGRGRPPIGTPIEVRLSAEQLARIDAWAGSSGIRVRAEAIRRLLDLGLDHDR